MSVVHRWIRRLFLLWAVISMAWLANSVRTQGVGAESLRSSSTVSVVDGAATLAFLPRASPGKTALLFLCGSGVAAKAYAPLLRPVAEAGFSVHVVKLPYRFAPFDAHKQAALDRARGVIASRPDITRWVISGHSLGAALACRLAQSDPKSFSAMVLIATTHPKEADLSSLAIPVTKVYGSHDGIAPAHRVLANKRLLPPRTKWVEINGANHSQFGHYGHQLFDGSAAISREAQQASARLELLRELASAAGSGG